MTAGLFERAQKRLAAIVGPEHVAREYPELEQNSLGLRRRVTGVVYPAGVEQVAAIVHIAAELGVTLYPLSCGCNTGYGDRLPAGDDQLIVDLRRMNKIRSFDAQNGLIELEPGVTQQQLYEFLRVHNAAYVMDATGSTVDSSIIGNTLEGGFGHTPFGNRRRGIVDLEAVTGSGTILRTGAFPALGPDLSGAFVQSNFGIVTALTFRLMPRPEQTISYVINIRKDDALGPLVEECARLRRDGTIDGLLHFANAVRAMMTTQKFADLQARGLVSSAAISNERAAALLSSPLLSAGHWNAMGALFGSKAAIIEKKRLIRQAVRGKGDVRFFDEARLCMIERLCASRFMTLMPGSRMLTKSIEGLRFLHNLVQGIPGNQAYVNMTWRAAEAPRLGLIWFAPVITPSREQVEAVIRLAAPIYQEAGFEMPVTLSLVEPHRAVATLSISFDRSRQVQCEAAQQAYAQLSEAFAAAGIFPYRMGIHGMRHVRYEPGKAAVLSALKKAFDPCGVIAPGRYAIN